MAALVLLVAVAAGGLLASPAAAQTYGPQPVTLSCTVSVDGTTVRVSCTASGFASGAVLSFSIVSPSTPLGSAQANASGVGSLAVALPSTLAAGTYTIQATGTAANGQSVVASTTITIPGAAQSTGSTLPRTGSNSIPLVNAGSALVAAGGLLLLAATKRRTRRRLVAQG